MEKGLEIRTAIEELSKVKVKPSDDHDNAHIPIKPFLLACHFLLEVLDEIGPTMAVLRQDVHQNIQRLEKLYESNSSTFSNLIEMLKKEVNEGSAKQITSCSKALLWLTRSMDFVVALLDKLAKDDPALSMEQAVEESYNVTLKPWHGWISLAAYKVALQLVPERKAFINLLKTNDKEYDILKEEMQSLISLLLPLLDEIHSTLRSFRLDNFKST